MTFLPEMARRNSFRAAFFKEFNYWLIFKPQLTYKAMGKAFNKTVDQVRAQDTAQALIEQFNGRLLEMLAELEERPVEKHEEDFGVLLQRVEDMIDTLINSMFWSIYGEGGRGWPSPKRAKQILEWRKIGAPKKGKGRNSAAQTYTEREHMESLEKYYTIAEVAEIVRVSRRTVYAWRDAGKLKAVKVGRGLRVSQTELNRILEGGIEIPSPWHKDQGAGGEE